MCFYDDFTTYVIDSVSYAWNGWKNTSSSAQYIAVLTTISPSSSC